MEEQKDLIFGLLSYLPSGWAMFSLSAMLRMCSLVRNKFDQGWPLMLEESLPIRRVKIWSMGFTALFVLLAFLALVFTIHLSDWTLRFLFDPFNVDAHQVNYYVCAELGPQSLACLENQGESIFIPADAFFLSLCAMGALVLICLAGLFMTESKLMRLGVFPLQIFSVIVAGHPGDHWNPSDNKSGGL